MIKGLQTFCTSCCMLAGYGQKATHCILQGEPATHCTCHVRSPLLLQRQVSCVTPGFSGTTQCISKLPYTLICDWDSGYQTTHKTCCDAPAMAPAALSFTRWLSHIKVLRCTTAVDDNSTANAAAMGPATHQWPYLGAVSCLH